MAAHPQRTSACRASASGVSEAAGGTAAASTSMGTPVMASEEDEAPVVFLMATHGEGEPTDNARVFYDDLIDMKPDTLPGVQ